MTVHPSVREPKRMSTALMSYPITGLTDVLHRHRQYGLASIVTIALGFQSSILAEVTEPLIDERCESEQLLYTISFPIEQVCWDRESNACIEARMLDTDETQEQAEEFCWNRPFESDPRFLGPCPEYLEELESDTFDGEEWLLPRIILRMAFSPLNEHGQRSSDYYKREESVQSLRRLLTKDPDNVVALSYLRSNLFHVDDLVQDLTIEMKLHALDPDCPSNRWLRTAFIFNLVYELADNWWSGNGAGSELTQSERKALLLGARSTLLDMYDIAVVHDSGTDRLYWALQSIHDYVLSGYGKNLGQIADQLDVDIEDYAEERTSSLVQAFSDEFNVDSVHGRTHSLGMICNDYAFELGLSNHCVNLLEYFGQEDAELPGTLATDWAQAAILLVNWLTLDCSDHPYFVSGPASDWWNDRRCPTEENVKSIERVSTLLSQFSSKGSSTERELLEAYLSLDDKSHERFRRAFAIDTSVAPYGSRLAKRLLKQGAEDSANGVLVSIYEVGIPNDPRNVDKELLDKVKESVDKGTYSNWREPHRDVF